MRDRRRALTVAEQHTAALSLANHLLTAPLFWRSRRIAFYVARDGEIDPLPLLYAAASITKRCYLPCLQPAYSGANRHLLWFQRYVPGDPLAANRYGIPEPLNDPTERLRPQVLDLVLLPLVAFDRSGHRLGMGGGYYDRTFAFTASRSAWRRPALIGLAHACQEAAGLPGNAWDIPLDGIATDAGLSLFTRREHRDGNP